MSKRTAADRFSQIIANGHISLQLKHIYTTPDKLNLTPLEVWFISNILQFKWDEGLPFPSLNKLCKRSGMSSATVHKLKKSLEDKGYLRVVSRYRIVNGEKTRARSSNAYDFGGLFEKIEELIKEEEQIEWEEQEEERYKQGVYLVSK